MSDVQALATQALEAVKLAQRLELEAQSAHGYRWNELRGDIKGPGLVYEAEMAAKVAKQKFVDELVRTTGLSVFELRGMI